MIQAKAIYKADINGDVSVIQQIEEVKDLSIRGGDMQSKQFEVSLLYEVTREVVNILSNATITYDAKQTALTASLQEYLIKIYFELYEYGYCYLIIDSEGNITGVNNTHGVVKITDPTYDITNYTQKAAVKKQLEMYSAITNVKYSVIDERGVMGIFSPKKDVVIKPTQAKDMYQKFRDLFGAKQSQRKFAILETGMDYQGVTLPIADLKLLENEVSSIGSVARLFNIQEDMLLRGATYDNKDAAIIQTYTSYKGLIYSYINQIEKQLVSFPHRYPEHYEVTFGGVPQLIKTDEYEK